MERLFLILVLMLGVTAVYATEYSEFAAKEYAQRNNKDRAHITVKKEHIEEYAQEIGGNFVPYIAYGYGDLKAPKQRKKRITYICLLDGDKKPVWSCVTGR